MSTDYSIFIKNKDSSSTIKDCLENVLNCPLHKVTHLDGDMYSADLIGVTITLYLSVRFEDDGVIEFSKYDYWVGVDYTGAFDKLYGDEFCLMCCLVIANMIFRKLNCECIVVEDVQKVIETFAPK